MNKRIALYAAADHLHKALSLLAQGEYDPRVQSIVRATLRRVRGAADAETGGK